MNISSSFDLPTLWPLEALRSQSALGNVPILRSLGSRFFLSAPMFGLIILVAYFSWLSSATAPVVKGPVAGCRSWLEPTALLRLRFVFNAVKIMNDGYYKVWVLIDKISTRLLCSLLTSKKFKDTSYVVRRMDTDVTMLALKYLNELRKSGLDELNATHANIHVRCSENYLLCFLLS